MPPQRLTNEEDFSFNSRNGRWTCLRCADANADQTLANAMLHEKTAKHRRSVEHFAAALRQADLADAASSTAIVPPPSAAITDPLLDAFFSQNIPDNMVIDSPPGTPHVQATRHGDLAVGSIRQTAIPQSTPSRPAYLDYAGPGFDAPALADTIRDSAMETLRRYLNDPTFAMGFEDSDDDSDCGDVEETLVAKGQDVVPGQEKPHAINSGGLWRPWNDRAVRISIECLIRY